MEGRNRGTLGDLNSTGLPPVHDIPGRGRFSGDRGPCKWEMVFSFFK